MDLCGKQYAIEVIKIAEVVRELWPRNGLGEGGGTHKYEIKV